MGGFAGRNAKLVLAGSAVVMALSVWGIAKIEVNDNPIRWFESSHEIRVADRVINDRFAGSYMAYLQFQPASGAQSGDQPFKQPQTLRWIAGLQQHLEDEVPTVGKAAGLTDIIKTVHRELLGSEEAFRIPDEEALHILYDLVQEEGLCLGGSAGINIAGAVRMARKMGPGHTIVTILCDSGTRYQSKLYNPAFLTEKGLPVPEWLDRET